MEELILNVKRFRFSGGELYHPEFSMALPVLLKLEYTVWAVWADH